MKTFNFKGNTFKLIPFIITTIILLYCFFMIIAAAGRYHDEREKLEKTKQELKQQQSIQQQPIKEQEQKENLITDKDDTDFVFAEEFNEKNELIIQHKINSNFTYIEKERKEDNIKKIRNNNTRKIIYYLDKNKNLDFIQYFSNKRLICKIEKYSKNKLAFVEEYDELVYKTKSIQYKDDGIGFCFIEEFAYGNKQKTTFYRDDGKTINLIKEFGPYDKVKLTFYNPDGSINRVEDN